MPLLHWAWSLRTASFPTSRRQAPPPADRDRVAGSRRSAGGENFPVERRIADTGIAAVAILWAESGRSWPGRPSHPHPCRLVPPLPAAPARSPSLPSTLHPRGRVATHPARSPTSQVSQSLQRSHTQVGWRSDVTVQQGNLSVPHVIPAVPARSGSVRQPQSHPIRSAAFASTNSLEGDHVEQKGPLTGWHWD